MFFKLMNVAASNPFSQCRSIQSFNSSRKTFHKEVVTVLGYNILF